MCPCIPPPPKARKQPPRHRPAPWGAARPAPTRRGGAAPTGFPPSMGLPRAWCRGRAGPASRQGAANGLAAPGRRGHTQRCVGGGIARRQMTPAGLPGVARAPGGRPEPPPAGRSAAGAAAHIAGALPGAHRGRRSSPHHPSPRQWGTPGPMPLSREAQPGSAAWRHPPSRLGRHGRLTHHRLGPVGVGGEAHTGRLGRAATTSGPGTTEACPRAPTDQAGGTA